MLFFNYFKLLSCGSNFINLEIKETVAILFLGYKIHIEIDQMFF